MIKIKTIMKRENSQQKSIRNRYGIEIKMCCASCRHKKIKADGRRVCTLMQILVRQQFVCPKWAVTDGLMNAGKH